MVDFLHRGLLNPPSGVEDGLSLGTISRRVEVDASLSLSISDSPDPVDNNLDFEATFACTVGGLAQTGLTLAITVQYPIGWTFEVTPDEPTTTSNGGWTPGAWSWDDTNKRYTATYTRASHTVSTSSVVLSVDTGTAANHSGTITTSAVLDSTEANSTSDSENTTVQLPAVFDATVTTPTNGSAHAIVDIGGGGSGPLPCTVTAVASGRNQTFGSIEVMVYDSYGAGALISSITTTDLAGWTQTSAWTLGGGGVWTAVFTKSTVNLGSYEIDFSITASGLNTGQVTITTNGTTWGPPQTSEDFGAGNSITVDFDEAADPITWDVDAASGWNWPANATQWTDFRSYKSITAHGNPSVLHHCQELSGNLADSIGSYLLTKQGVTQVHDVTVPDFTRKGITFVPGSNTWFRYASSANFSTTPVAMFAIVRVEAQPDGTTRQIFGVGGASDTSLGLYTSAGVTRLRYRENANILDSAAGVDLANQVLAVLLVIDPTNSRARVYTQNEKLAPAYGAPATNTWYALGGINGQAAQCTILGSFGIIGSDAEALSTDANAKKLIESITNLTVTAF